MAGTFLLTVAGIFVGHAVRSDVQASSRISALAWALTIVVAFLLGVAAYNLRFDPTRDDGTRLWEYVVRDYSEVQCLPLRGEPGGAEVALDVVDRPLQGLCGEHTHYVECRETLPDGSTWLRLAGMRYWVDERDMRPRAGSSDEGLPDCS